MIFVLIFGALLVGLLIWCYVSRWSKDRCTTHFQDGLLIPLIFLLVIAVSVAIPVYCCTLSDYGKLMAYKQVEIEYSLAITQTSDVLQNSVSIGVLGLAYNQYSSQIAHRIEERRDKAIWYYECKEQTKMYLSHWFTRQFMPKPPEGLLD